MSSKNVLLVVQESIAVGLFLILFIYVAQFILRIVKYPTVATPAECKRWNKTYIMEATAFLAGFLFHMVFEYAGINKWYVKNY